MRKPTPRSKEAKAAEKAAEKEAKKAEREAKAAAKKAEKEEHEKTNPKKPKSAYLFFLDDFRGDFKAENPEAGVTDVAKAGGVVWKELEPEKRKKYDDMHEEAMAKYSERCGELGIEVKVKAPPKPKAPSAFELYAHEKEDLCKRRYKLSEYAEDFQAQLESKLVFMWKNQAKAEQM